MDKDPPPLKIHRTLLRQKLPLHATTRPELMIHLAPRILGIGAKIRRPVLATHHRRRVLVELEIDDRLRVDGRFDAVGFAVLGQGHADVVGVEVVAVGGEGEVLEVVAAPEVRGGGVRVGDLAGELGGFLDAPAVKYSVSKTLPLHAS